MQALVKTARFGQPITVIDGCPLHCAHACLENIGMNPERHVRLYDFGFGKHYGQSYGDEAVEEVCRTIVSDHDREASIQGATSLEHAKRGV